MKVLYIIDSLISGGAETSLAHMAPGYRDQGIDLHVAFLKSRWDVADELEAAGATLHPTELDRSRFRQLRALVRLIRELRPDVVHTTLWEADVLGRVAAALSRTPVVTTFPTSRYSKSHFDDPSVGRMKLRLAQAADVATALLAVRFQAVSEEVATNMADRMHVGRRRIAVVGRARRRDLLGEPSQERRARVRRSLDIDEGRPVVLAVARHEYAKGLDVLVASAVDLRRVVPSVLVLVAGRTGRMTPSLERQVDDLGLGDVIRFMGMRSDVADLIVGADVVVVPSRVEGLPGTVLEAMALERPVVASDIPNVVEAIGDHAAGLIPTGDARRLAEALGLAIRDPDDEATAAARRRFDESFSPMAVVAGMNNLYDEAIADSRWTRSRSR